MVYDNRAFGNFLGKPGPERNFIINISDVPVRMTVNVPCTSDPLLPLVPVAVYLFDDCPISGTMLTNSSHFTCGEGATSYMDFFAAGTLWIIVDSAAPGDFQLNISCTAQTWQPTMAPSPAPTYGACTYQPIDCGESSYQSNGVYRNVLGGDGGDVMFRFQPNASHYPMRVVASTCDAKTEIDSVIWIYDGCPTENSSRLVTRQGMMESFDDNCSVHFDVAEDLDRTGEYWIVVDANGTRTRGYFGFTLYCYQAPTGAPSLPPSPQPSMLPTPHPSPVPSMLPTSYPTTQPCSYTYLECGGSYKGNNFGAPNIQGYPSGDKSFLLNVTFATFVEASTCSDFTNFETSLAFYDTCPHTGGNLIRTEDLADKVKMA